ncbi:hypothetical protein [Halohasta litorea]|uniref:Uncharacterized protein n=1 Tax=Halohasta litorea TaxID=869891 RepID=A0ABD6D335_9EURY|nr:hypothetical protein [Halohasta litorea]
MDRAKLAVYLVGLFGLVTIGQAAGLASMAGFKPQLSVFFGSGLAMSGVAVWTLNKGCYEEFDLFRRRELAFWAVTVGVLGYIAVVPLQFV